MGRTEQDAAPLLPYNGKEQIGSDVVRGHHTRFPFIRRVSKWLLVAILALCTLYAHRNAWATRLQTFCHEAIPNRGGHFLTEKRIEDLFLSVPDEQSALHASRLFASKPHMAGTEGDLTTAKLFLQVLQKELGAIPPVITAEGSEPIFEAGSDESRNATLSITERGYGSAARAWIDTYYPVMNSPLTRTLEILGDDGEPVWSANVEEIADSTDPEAGEHATSVPAFHGLSGNGTAEGKLVYAGWGTKEEYDKLEADGVDLKGKVVITRYGGIFRGLKVKGAEDRGAAGVLIYSDIRDDGTVTPDNGYVPYPHGPARNPTSVQRGSVQYLSVYPGDPTTPGFPAYENATRTDGANIPNIPSLPISWANAQMLLKELEADGGNRTVRLVNHVDERVIKIWNTMGVIPGHIRDEVVVIGNHRDAWVMGATDPSSGTASVHEMLRGFGALLKTGWKPLRTIVIASWDAEEYGLIGSTEWGEDFADWISQHTVAYLNLDSSVSGSRFRASASPSMAHMVRQAAQKVPHPTDKDRTLWDARSDSGGLTGPAGLEELDEDVVRMYELQHGAASGGESVGVGPLGSGSDYTVFLQRIGIASSNGGFGATLQDPVYHYHSVFDSVRWQEMYADPGFFRHVAISKYLGLQALALSGSLILPLNTTHYALELGTYLDEVEAIASTTSLDVDFGPLRESIDALQSASVALDKEKKTAEKKFLWALKRWRKHRIIWRLRRKMRRALCKIRRRLGKPCHRSRRAEVAREMVDDRYSTLSGIPSWIWEDLKDDEQCGAETVLRGKRGKWVARKLMKAAKRVQKANSKLVAFERGLISEGGIKDREWYKHLGVAPGKWLGYGATTLPALTEAFTIDNNATQAEYEVGRLKDLISSLAVTIRP